MSQACSSWPRQWQLDFESLARAALVDPPYKIVTGLPKEDQNIAVKVFTAAIRVNRACLSTSSVLFTIQNLIVLYIVYCAS